MEIWKDIPNYSGYQVSDLGRVKTKSKITYKNGIERHWKDRILKQKTSTNKYGRQDYRVELWSNGNHKTFLVARLIAFTFFDKDINNSQLTVNHKDGNSTNNSLNNLEVVSLKENIKHGFRTGLYENIQKKVKIINKENGEVIYSISLCVGSKKINKAKGYLSQQIIRNNFENDKYKWEVLSD